MGLSNSLLSLGALLGCLMSPLLTHLQLSFKKIAILCDFIGCVGCLISLFYLSSEEVYFGRFICGIFAGIHSSFISIYIRDISPVEV